MIGDGNNNVITGSAGDDTIDGGAGDDTLIGGLGNDSLIEGTGFDTAVFSATKASYSIVTGTGTGASAGNVTVTGPDGVDVLTGIETLTFSDATVSVDDNSVIQSKLDDFVVLQFASPAIVGADAGNDTYLI